MGGSLAARKGVNLERRELGALIFTCSSSIHGGMLIGGETSDPSRRSNPRPSILKASLTAPTVLPGPHADSLSLLRFLLLSSAPSSACHQPAPSLASRRLAFPSTLPLRASPVLTIVFRSTPRLLPAPSASTTAFIDAARRSNLALRLARPRLLEDVEVATEGWRVTRERVRLPGRAVSEEVQRQRTARGGRNATRRAELTGGRGGRSVARVRCYTV